MIPVIREATALELEVIQLLIQRIWKPTYRDILTDGQSDYMLARMYDRATLQQQMEEGHVFLLLCEDESPAGFAGFQFDYPEAGTCKLHKIYLLPETQGKGLGLMLLHAVMERARAAGQHSLVLNVNRHNKAFHFYRKLGFEVIATEDIDIGNGYFMNDYLLQRSLDDYPGA